MSCLIVGALLGTLKLRSSVKSLWNQVWSASSAERLLLLHACVLFPAGDVVDDSSMCVDVEVTDAHDSQMLTQDISDDDDDDDDHVHRRSNILDGKSLNPFYLNFNPFL